MIRLNCIAILLCASLVNANDAANPAEGAEARLLPKFSVVKRDGLTLVIRTSSAPVVFTDNPNNTEMFSKCELYSYFRIDRGRTDYIVRRSWWESQTFSIINGKTGATIEVPALPVISPDKKRYLTSSIDLEVGYAPNVLSIIRTADFSTEASFDFNTPERPGGPLDSKWISPTEVSLVIATVAQDGKSVRSVPMRIQLKDGKWTGPQSEEK